MNTISINLPLNDPQGETPCPQPIHVSGTYTVDGKDPTAVRITVAIHHPVTDQDIPFGPLPPGSNESFDVPCSDLESSNGMIATVTARLLQAPGLQELAVSAARQIAIA